MSEVHTNFAMLLTKGTAVFADPMVALVAANVGARPATVDFDSTETTPTPFVFLALALTWVR